MLGNLILIGKTNGLFHSYPSHDHSFWEIALYTHGKGTAWSGEAKIPFSEGSIICNPPHVRHKEHAENGYENIVIQLHTFSAESGKALVMSDPEHKPILTLMELLNKEFHLRRKRWRQACEEMLQALLFYLSALDDYAASDEGIGNKAVAQMENELVENLHNPDFSVEKAIADLGYTHSYFAKIFRSCTKKTPLQYLLDLRIAQAQTILTTTELNVSETAYSVGFNDPYYFSRAFKKRVGVSPIKFRLAEGGGTSKVRTF